MHGHRAQHRTRRPAAAAIARAAGTGRHRSGHRSAAHRCTGARPVAGQRRHPVAVAGGRLAAHRRPLSGHVGRAGRRPDGQPADRRAGGAADAVAADRLPHSGDVQVQGERSGLCIIPVTVIVYAPNL